MRTAAGVARVAADMPAPISTYYPGVASLVGAQPIDVRAGEERIATDFALAEAGRPATLGISFTDAAGHSVAGSALLSTPPDSPGGPLIWAPPIFASSISLRVEPGEWVVYARGDRLVGVVRLSVASGDDLAVTIPLTEGARIEGRVVTDGAPLPRDAVVEIATASLDLPSRAGGAFAPVERMRADGTFAVSNLLGRQQLRVRIVRPHGWAVKAIEYDGHGLLDRTLDFRGGESLTGVRIVLTDRCAAITGTAVDARRDAVADYSVLVFPADATLPRNLQRVVRWVRPNVTGEFVVDELLPGDYLAVAVDDVDETQWLNADYLARFRRRATAVTLGEREKKSVTLALTPP